VDDSKGTLEYLCGSHAGILANDVRRAPIPVKPGDTTQYPLLHRIERRLDAPFKWESRSIVLHPIQKPTVDQIRYVQRFTRMREGFLGVRHQLQNGGIRSYGQLTVERADELSRELADLGIPHQIAIHKIDR
jgi:hypothetical protein